MPIAPLSALPIALPLPQKQKVFSKAGKTLIIAVLIGGICLYRQTTTIPIETTKPSIPKYHRTRRVTALPPPLLNSPNYASTLPTVEILQPSAPAEPTPAMPMVNPLVGVWDCKDVFASLDEPKTYSASYSRYVFWTNGTGTFQYLWLGGEMDTLHFVYHMDGASVIMESSDNPFMAQRTRLTRTEFPIRNIFSRYLEEKAVVTYSLSDDKTRLTLTSDLRASLLKSYKSTWSGFMESGIDPGPELKSSPEPSIYNRQ